ncbi:MAG: thioredoxin family protein [Candidatus Cloacimonadales bacterium]|nr:thioredoxin family protein [Candidatus Cloacimonadales bacterium]
MDFKELKQEKFSFIYITIKDCNVCKELKPKLLELAASYAGSSFHNIFLDDHKDAAGFFMAFAVPTFLVFSEGRELLRSARHLDMEEIKNKLDRYYEMLLE